MKFLIGLLVGILIGAVIGMFSFALVAANREED